MIGFIIFELSLLVGLWLTFIVMMSFARREKKFRLIRWWKSPIYTQLVGIAVIGAVEALSLIALGTGHELPLWVYALVFGAVDVVAARWLWLTWTARRTSALGNDDETRDTEW